MKPHRARDIVGSTLVALSILSAPLLARPTEPRPGGADTVHVDLRTIPFYAVDGRGQPIFDLTADDIELRIEGESITPDVFDRWVTTAQSIRDRPPEPRQVFLLFDHVFASPASIKRSQQLGRELLDRIPLSDRVHLLSFHGEGGFRHQLGPIRPDDRGKRALNAEIKRFRPTVARTKAINPGEALYSSALGLPPVGDQQTYVYWAAATLHNSEYRDAALDLASAWETLALRMSQISGPKLLVVFSGGIDSTFYLEGSLGLGLGSKQDQVHGTGVHFEAIRYRVEPALESLASSGTVPIFVNTQGDDARGRAAMQHMSEYAGGLFLERGSIKNYADDIAAATSAYYEAGFYADAHRSFGREASVEIAILRPGVRAVFPKRLKASPRFSSLTEQQKQLALLDVVYHGAPSPALPALHRLDGDITSTPGATGSLRYLADRPDAVRDRPLDLCTVGYRLADGNADDPTLTHFDCHPLDAATSRLRVETKTPGAGSTVWGIVAVDPASGEAYLQRLEITVDHDGSVHAHE